MSAPITASAFSQALPALPLSTLHAKVAELRNSISHLISSNNELESYAEAGDQECKDAIEENKEVIGRMEERLKLVKAEVEMRGLRWEDEWGVEEGDMQGAEKVNGGKVEEETTVKLNGEGQQQGRGLSDGELELALRRRLEEDGMEL
ncbi:MAG: hypothetical protein M1839_004395 [Geoglossum umbratile]|nr:MAG: hypothetical protein M1839_004395 [Geoglossum umbratile]